MRRSVFIGEVHIGTVQKHKRACFHLRKGALAVQHLLLWHCLCHIGDFANICSCMLSDCAHLQGNKLLEVVLRLLSVEPHAVVVLALEATVHIRLVRLWPCP